MQENNNRNPSAFRAYMEAPKHAIAAFNAAQEGELPLDTPVEYIDIGGIPYLDPNENVVCLAGDRLIVFAEQSTVYTPNLPLRLLLGIGRLYGKLLERWECHSAFTVLPAPVFIACCGRNVPLPENRRQELSTAFTGADPAIALCVSFVRVDYDTDENPKA